ncbi:MAG: hypothetical protein KY394_07560 [Actinobacteria bacterium]|nr:hypothetical protein [Actinomycetota bacterium]
MRSERGSVTIWMLGLSLLLLVFGGLSLDFWRGLAVQRELAAVADSAAIAGAAGIDVDHYRATGEVLLDPAKAKELVAASIGFQESDVSGVSVSVATGGDSVTVVVEGIVELGLLGVFVDQSEPLLVRATATAVPRLQP